MKTLLAAIFGLLLAMSWDHYVTHAQTPASVVQVDTMQGSITTCQVHAGVSTLCIGTDGLAFSKIGAAYTDIPLSTTVGTGVTSITINGTTKQGPTPTFQLLGTTTAPGITSTAVAPSTVIAAQ